MIGFSINDNLVKNLANNAEVGITIIRRRAVMASTFYDVNRRLQTIPMQWATYQLMLLQHENIKKLKLNNQSYFAQGRPFSMMDATIATITKR